MKKNLLLLAVAAIFSYFVLEMGWRSMLDRVPLTLHKELGRLQWLAQPTKKGIIPKDYIMILGDSYAEGLGDWLMRVVSEGNPKFNAAHILHDRTGRDVLTFGFRGGSPSWTFVFQAPAAFHGINLYAGMKVPEPTDVLAFFFAGNDVNDESAKLRLFMPAEFDRGRAADEDYVREYFNGLGAQAAAASKDRWHPLRNAHLFDTATKLIKLAVKNWGKKNSALAATDPSFRGGANTYREDWTRHERVRVFFRTRNGLKPYPSPTVEPFAFDSDQDIRTAAVWFQESLRHLKGLFPRARITAVYIPTPAASYDLADGTVLMDRVREATSESPGPETFFSTAALEAANGRVCGAAAAAAAKAGAAFIDTRPHLRRRSFEWGYLHGPSDVSHFNERGYTALAEAIEAGMKRPDGPGCL